MRHFFIFSVLFSILSGLVFATTIHGNIYDLNLKKVNDVKVEINTSPKQAYVSKDGAYNFEVPLGDYSLNAFYHEDNLLISSASENISVKDEGRFRVDLILFPSFEEEEILMKEDIKMEGNIFGEKSTIPYVILISFFLIIFLLIIFSYYKRRMKADIKVMKADAVVKEQEKEAFEKEPIVVSTDLDAILKIIEDEGGRTTQKEIRKRIPLSEAKISLMITELESKGIIKRIKKGRGNIVILNR